MKTSIMLDLETAGNTPNAAIIAIGAVAIGFNNGGIVSKFYTQVNLETSVDAGGVIDPSTFMWWLNQSDSARNAFKDNDKAASITAALNSFSQWYEDVDGCDVWGNGAVFDNVILSQAYHNAGIEKPWQHWQDRCYRTVKNQNPIIKLKRVGTHHNALDDAESQALHLIDICNALGKIL